MTALVVAEHGPGGLSGAASNVVAAALQVAREVHVLIAGSGTAAAAHQAAALQGVTKVLRADGAALAHGLSENLEALVLTVARAYAHILFPSSAIGKSVAPRVAAKLDVAQISDVIRVHDGDTFDRPVYAGSAIATVKSSDPIKVITVRTTAFATAQGGGSASIETLQAVEDTGKSGYLGGELSNSERPELATAKIVVAGGRGFGSREKFHELLTPLADKLGAALGASRAAVDAGYAPNDWQVGQTGKIVAPSLYIACGISGAVQHLAGMKDSKVIVAINKDAEAPIFSVADYYLEADLFEAIPALVKALP